MSDQPESPPPTAGWRPIHTVGVIVTLIGAVGTALIWILAIQTKGVFVRWELVVTGPTLLAHGVSMLAFPRVWSGPDGNTIQIHKSGELLTLAAGLLLGAFNVLALRAARGCNARMDQLSRTCIRRRIGHAEGGSGGRTMSEAE